MTFAQDIKSCPNYFIVNATTVAQITKAMIIDNFPQMIPAGKESEYQEWLKAMEWDVKIPSIGMSLKAMVDSPDIEVDLAILPPQPQKYDKCPKCQKDMDASWDTCPFCAIPLIVAPPPPPPSYAPQGAVGQAPPPPANPAATMTMPCKKCGFACSQEQWANKVCGFCQQDPTKMTVGGAIQNTVNGGFEAVGAGTAMVVKGAQQYQQAQTSIAGAMAPPPPAPSAGICPYGHPMVHSNPEFFATHGNYCYTCENEIGIGYEKDLKAKKALETQQ